MAVPELELDGRSPVLPLRQRGGRVARTRPHPIAASSKQSSENRTSTRPGGAGDGPAAHRSSDCSVETGQLAGAPGSVIRVIAASTSDRRRNFPAGPGDERSGTGQ
jgi:hypothetical protein